MKSIGVELRAWESCREQFCVKRAIASSEINMHCFIGYRSLSPYQDPILNWAATESLPLHTALWNHRIEFCSSQLLQWYSKLEQCRICYFFYIVYSPDIATGIGNGGKPKMERPHPTTLFSSRTSGRCGNAGRLWEQCRRKQIGEDTRPRKNDDENKFRQKLLRAAR